MREVARLFAVLGLLVVSAHGGKFLITTDTCLDPSTIITLIHGLFMPLLTVAGRSRLR